MLAALALASPAWSAPVPGLVAAYSFDEGSGAVAGDVSGNAHPGSVVGATWVPGRYGGALSFDGVGNYVGLGQLGTFYTGGFTFEAWVQKRTANKNDAAVVGTWTGTQTGGPMIWVDHIATRYQLTFGQTYSNYLDSGRNPIAGQWQHLAATYDGTTARFYVDGTQVASRTVSGPIGSSNTWRVGAYDTNPGGFFDGLIDDVRIYNRALSSAEIQTDMNTPLGIADTNAPTVPGNFVTTSTTTSSVSVQWSPSTDDNGVSGYRLFRDGTQVGTTSATSFTFTGLSCSTSYTLGVEAYDGSGNASARATQTTSTAACAGAQLIAAYAFDEGSGSVAADASGRGNTGTIVGATWAQGRYGGALSFNGNGNYVNLGQLGTFYATGFTLEAWVQKSTATKGDTAVVGTWTVGGSGGPMLWTDLAPRYRLTLGNRFSDYLDSGRTPVAGQWQHLAATYDGVNARFYVDGVQVASSTFTGNVGSSNTWRIGAYDSSPVGFFDGLIDEVRVYDAPRSAAQIQADMATPLPSADTTPPSAPGAVTATGGVGQATVTWSASTDDRGVTRYNVHRSTVSGFTPTAANRIAQPTGTSYTDTGLAPGTYYYKVTAEDAAGNVSTPSAEAAATVTASDTTPPTVSITNPAEGASASGVVTFSANAQDNQGLAGVQFRVDGENRGAEDQAAPYSLAWDTRGEVNGSRTLTAVARDSAGNTTTSAPVRVTVSNTGVSTQGLKVAYAFDDGSGSFAVDTSGNYATGTLANAGWSTAGRFGGAVSLGSNGEVDPPALGTFYTAGFTLEAWVYKQTTKVDSGIVGTWVGSQGGGPMLWIDGAGRYRLTLGSTLSNYLDSGRTAVVGQWQHVAATYDGSVARFYVDGVQTATSTFTGNIGSSNTWRIGAYNATPEGFFQGLVDDVRVYSRPLTAAEVATDMASRIQPDRTPPTVTSSTPADGATQVSVAAKVTAKFSEPMRASTITSTAFVLKDAANNVVPASVAYDSATFTATLTPLQALDFSTTYRAVLTSGGPSDLSGNGLASDVSWSFATDAAPPPVLLVGSTANPFAMYLGELLRSEGLSEFTSIDVSLLSPALLANVDVVVLGQMPLTAPQVTMLSNWVNAGGSLIAMRPDKQLAGLLGLTDAGTTLANAYLKVDTTTAPGAGIAAATMQFHGTADRYTVNGATAIATLYSNATTATASPAVSWRAVGSSGGKAIAFSYDLARSVAYTRQGNPAWVGQNRDGFEGIAADDLFYGARNGDVQPDWIDTSKIAIPQADEQQRLLVNLITVAERDRLPLPRFWYLPRGLKAALALTSDDHSTSNSPGGTAFRFDRLKALSNPGCVVASWECVRATSYIYPVDALTNAQATSYVSDGFELALHPVFGSCPTTVQTQSQIAATYASQLADFRAKYTGVPVPVTNRNHCYYWPDWSSVPKVELASGARMDLSYPHYPAWIGNKPGFMTGSGFPMRFADADGAPIDVYQEETHLADDGTTAAQTPAFIASLLDNALGAPGYYGAFGVLIHAENPVSNQALEDVVAAAKARNVPIVSSKQLLDWTDGRNNSTLRDLRWSNGTLTFTVSAAAGANGLQTMLPTRGPAGTLSGITRGGSPVSYTVQTIKGIDYAMFDSPSGAYVATYS